MTQVVLSVGVDPSQAESGVRVVRRSFEDMSRDAGKATSAVDVYNQSLGRMGGTAGNAASALDFWTQELRKAEAAANAQARVAEALGLKFEVVRAKAKETAASLIELGKSKFAGGLQEEVDSLTGAMTRAMDAGGKGAVAAARAAQKEMVDLIKAHLKQQEDIAVEAANKRVEGAQKEYERIRDLHKGARSAIATQERADARAALDIVKDAAEKEISTIKASNREIISNFEARANQLINIKKRENAAQAEYERAHRLAQATDSQALALTAQATNAEIRLAETKRAAAADEDRFLAIARRGIQAKEQATAATIAQTAAMAQQQAATRNLSSGANAGLIAAHQPAAGEIEVAGGSSAAVRQERTDVQDLASELDKLIARYDYATAAVHRRNEALDVLHASRKAGIIDDEEEYQRLQRLISGEDERARQQAQAAERGAAENDRLAASYKAVMAGIDPAVAAQQKYERALAQVLEYHRSVGSSTEEMAADMDRVKASLSPAAVEAERAVKENKALADSYQRVMATIDPTIVAQQRYDKALADLRAGAAAAGVSADDLAAAEKRLEAALSPAALAAKREEESLRSLIGGLDQSYGAAERLAKGQALLDRAQRDGINGIKLSEAEHAKLSQVLRDQYETATRGAAGMKLAAHEATNAMYQVQDFWVQVGSGQSAMVAFIQQAPQFVGSVGGMERAMALLLSPTTLAVAGVAAFVGALALIGARAYQINSQIRELTVTTKAYGTEAQATAGQLREMAQALYEGGASRAESYATAKVLAATRGISASLGREMAGLADDMSAGLGGTVDETVKKLTALATEGFPAIAKLQEEIGFLNADEMNSVRTMAEHGRQSDALAIALAALHRRFDGLRQEAMTPAERAMHDLGVQFNRLVDAAAGSKIVLDISLNISGGFKDLADFIESPSMEGLGRLVGRAVMSSPAAIGGNGQLGAEIGAKIFGPADEAALRREIAAAKSRLAAIENDAAQDPVMARPEIDRARGDIEELERRLNAVLNKAHGTTEVVGSSSTVPAHRAANDLSGDDSRSIEQKNQKAIDYVNAQANAYDRLSQAMQGNAVQRAMAAAAMKAEDEIRDQNLQGANAERLMTLRLNEARIQLQVAVNDNNRAALAEVEGNTLLAQAYGVSTAAVREAQIQQRALAEVARGSIEPYDAIVARLQAVDDAQRRVQAAQFGATLRQQTEDAQRLAAAWGQGANAAREAALANEVLAEARKRGLDPTRDAGEIQGIADGVLARDAAQRAATFAQMAAEQRKAVELANAEYGMLGLSNAERAKAVAQMQAANDLAAKGADLTDAGTQAYIAQAGELGRVNAILQEAGQNAANIAQPIATGLEDAIVHAKSLGEILNGVGEDLKRIAVRQTITKPFENWLSGTITQMMTGPIVAANNNTPTPANDPGGLAKIVSAVQGGLGSSENSAMWVRVAGGAAALSVSSVAAVAQNSTLGKLVQASMAQPLPVSVADGGDIVQMLRSEARAQGVPEEVALAIGRIESNLRQYDPQGQLLTSSAGAQGVMQLMPGTASWLGVDATNTQENIRGGVKFLAMLGRQFGGDWNLAAAAYNAGPGTVQAWQRGERTLPAETVAYLQKLGPATEAARQQITQAGTSTQQFASVVMQTGARFAAVQQTAGGVTAAMEAQVTAQMEAAARASAGAAATQNLTAAQMSGIRSVLGLSDQAQSAGAVLGDNAAAVAANAAAVTDATGVINVLPNAIDRLKDGAISVAEAQGDAAQGAGLLANAASGFAGTVSDAATGLWNWVSGLFSSGAAAQTGAAAGQAQSGASGGSGSLSLQNAGSLSSASSLLTGSQSLYNAGKWFSMSSAGQWLGLSSTTALTPVTMAAGNAAAYGGGLTGNLLAAPSMGAGATASSASLTGLGSAFSDGLSYSPWGVVGSLGAGLLGIGKNADPYAKMALSTVGSIGGGMAGAAIGGGMSSAILGMEAGSVLGPIGAIVGAALGTALSGLIPADVQYPMSWYDAAGGQTRGAYSLDGGDPEPLRQAGDQVQAALRQLATSLNVPVSSLPSGGFTANPDGHPGTAAPKGYSWFSSAEGLGGWDDAKSAGSMEEAVKAYMLATLRGSDLSGVDPLVKRALNSNITDTDKLASVLSLAKQVADATAGLESFGKSLDDVVASAKKSATAQFDALKEQAALADEGDFGSEFRSLIERQIRSGFDPAVSSLSEMGAQSATITGQFDALREAVKSLGLSISETEVNAWEAEKQLQLRTSYSDTLTAAQNSAQGKDYLNQVATVAGQVKASRGNIDGLWGGDQTQQQAEWAKVVETNRIGAQKVIDDAGLLGSAFTDLTSAFSAALRNAGLAEADVAALTASLHESTAAREAATQAQEELQKRLLAAQVGAGQAAQAQLDAYATEVARRRELAAATDDATTAMLRQVHATEDAARAQDLASRSLAATDVGKIIAESRKIQAQWNIDKQINSAQADAVSVGAISKLFGSISDLDPSQITALESEFSSWSLAIEALHGALADARVTAVQDLASRALGSTADGSIISRVREIRAQGSKDSLIDRDQAATVAGAALNEVFGAVGDLDAGQLAALRAEFAGMPQVLAALEKSLASATDTAVETTRAAVDSVLHQAVDDAKSAYLDALGRERDALRQTAEQARALAKSASALRDSLALDKDLSTLDPGERLAEAKSQLDSAMSKLRAGDLEAGGEAQDLIRMYLETAREMYATGVGYGDAYDWATSLAREIEDLGGSLGASKDSQASAINKQITALGGNTDALLTVAEALASWQALTSPTRDWGDAAVADSNKLIAAAAAQSGHVYTGAFRNDAFKNFAIEQMAGSSQDFGTWGPDVARMLAVVTGYTGNFANDQFNIWMSSAITSGTVSDVQAAAARDLLTRTGNVPKFAGGGIIPHIPGISTLGVDSVPLIGMPGEGVVNLMGMSVLGPGGLAALNAGRAPWEAIGMPPANERFPAGVVAFQPPPPPPPPPPPRPSSSGESSGESSGASRSLEAKIDRLIALLEREGEASHRQRAKIAGELEKTLKQLKSEVQDLPNRIAAAGGK